jgi:hypothetical protein
MIVMQTSILIGSQLLKRGKMLAMVELEECFQEKVQILT